MITITVLFPRNVVRIKGNVTSKVLRAELGTLCTHTKCQLTLWRGESDSPQLMMSASHEIRLLYLPVLSNKPRSVSQKEKSYMPQNPWLGCKTLRPMLDVPKLHSAALSATGISITLDPLDQKTELPGPVRKHTLASGCAKNWQPLRLLKKLAETACLNLVSKIQRHTIIEYFQHPVIIHINNLSSIDNNKKLSTRKWWVCNYLCFSHHLFNCKYI